MGDQADAPEDHAEDCLFREAFRPTVAEHVGRALKTGADVPRPYVVRPPLDVRRIYGRGDVLTAELVLLGRAAALWPHFEHAARDLRSNDPALRPPPLRLASVLDGQSEPPGELVGMPATWVPVVPDEGSASVGRVHFLTPLVLRTPKDWGASRGQRSSGKRRSMRPSEVGTADGMGLLVRSVLRRLDQLTALWVDGAEGCMPRRSQVQAAVHVTRYDLRSVPTRSGTEGVMGSVDVEFCTASASRLLRAASVVHAGSQTTLDGSGWLAVAPGGRPI
ncbi:MAG: CRISPR system precrRNA processing endoribonuclease RAMP protein Cas6 [Bacteroidota bacterium]